MDAEAADGRAGCADAEAADTDAGARTILVTRIGV